MDELCLHKYSGAGNDFIVIDGRSCSAERYRRGEVITSLCSRDSGHVDAEGKVGADGLMILSPSECSDFRMEFFNPDGSSGMMCGNGGRCIAAFADKLGIVPSNGSSYIFDAPDGIHTAEILNRDGDSYQVRLKMSNPSGLRPYTDGWFIDTGTRHLVRFVDELESIDVAAEGSRLRQLPFFAPEGVNVDFVSIVAGGGSWPDGTRPSQQAGPLPLEPRAASPVRPISRPPASLQIRTFEKGVEAETLACGTGIVAAAVVFCHVNRLEAPQTIHVKAREDTLTVEILPNGIWLTGPAKEIRQDNNN